MTTNDTVCNPGLPPSRENKKLAKNPNPRLTKIVRRVTTRGVDVGQPAWHRAGERFRSFQG